MDIMEIMQRNKDKNFVQRVMNPTIFPHIKNEDGSVSTHLMASSEADGKHLVYPTILQDKSGKLTQREGDEAFDAAHKAGEFIEFDSAEEADWFARNYKHLWQNRPKPNFR